MSDRSKAVTVLSMNTLAFTVCFAVWVMNGVLVTYLVDNRIFAFDRAQVGWLLGVPILSGAILRLPVGMWTDRWGGRVVFPTLMLVAAAGAWCLSLATGYRTFLLGSFLFGIAGASFAVGVAYTSVWFPKERQGTALGLFGMGNAGAALTSFAAPQLLVRFTNDGADLDGWRALPRLYAFLLVVTAIGFALATENRTSGNRATLFRRLEPLRSLRVWRFGLYYLLLFGGFVALSQWLIPYYVNVYETSVATAGALASVFSLPTGATRALGGWLSDKFGARTTMYWVLGISASGFLLLIVPRMEVTSHGEGVMATAPGTVTDVTPSEVVVDETSYPIHAAHPMPAYDEHTLVWPALETWQTPAVRKGDVVARRQLLAHGTTHIYFQANQWVFTFLVLLVGIAMGVGMAAVYKHIPDYFPRDVGAVGGLVGVIGGLGGFLAPIAFGNLLGATGLWTTCWMLLLALTLVCLVWMHVVVRRTTRARAPHVAERMDSNGAPLVTAAPDVVPAPLGSEQAVG